MSTDAGQGTYGAKRQTWRKPNPREILRRLLEQHPQDSQSKSLERFTQKVLDDIEILEVIVEYWHSNNFRSLVVNPSLRVDRSESIKKSKEETLKTKEAIAEAIVETARVLLLELPMANGKLLRFCSGKECAKFGGWFSKIAERVGPRAIVGDVLSEADIRKLYSSR
jgi:hypothetical protein